MPTPPQLFLFGDAETEKFYNTGSSALIPPALFNRARARIHQIIAMHFLTDATFRAEHNLTNVPPNRNQWRITLWPLHAKGPAEWYIYFQFDGYCSHDIRIVRA